MGIEACQWIGLSSLNRTEWSRSWTDKFTKTRNSKCNIFWRTRLTIGIGVASPPSLQDSNKNNINLKHQTCAHGGQDCLEERHLKPGDSYSLLLDIWNRQRFYWPPDQYRTPVEPSRHGESCKRLWLYTELASSDPGWEIVVVLVVPCVYEKVVRNRLTVELVWHKSISRPGTDGRALEYLKQTMAKHDSCIVDQSW